jgi:hypothetical protein
MTIPARTVKGYLALRKIVSSKAVKTRRSIVRGRA